MSEPARRSDIPRAAAVSAALIALVLLLYGRTGSYDFVNYDDPVYVAKNPAVLEGLRPSSVSWAFREARSANWHPLTWMSHMLDVELFGLDAGGHHWTSVLLHAANSVLLLLALLALTGALWPSAVVAAFFAVHPSHVESVAWIAERKDVLSGTFWMLTLLAYAHYARRPSVARYALVALALALGLMAKSMLVTLPCVLLLLDHWPLGRRREGASLGRLVLEKLPLFALAGASSTVTLLTQSAEGAVGTLSEISLDERVWNALASYGAYLRTTFWPSDLACFYPHPAVVRGGGEDPFVRAMLWAAVLAAVTWACARLRARRPYLIVGWLWFVGTLVPVIGVLQVGSQSHADRYTYLPTIGVSIAVVWLAASFASRGVRTRRALAVAAGALVAAAASATWFQVPVWKDSRSLYEHALAVTDQNYLAHTNLGVLLLERGDLEAATEHLEAAERINRRYVDARYNLGLAYMGAGRMAEAEQQFRDVLRDEPQHEDARVNLRAVIELSTDADDVRAQYEALLARDPGDAATRTSLASLLYREGELDRAEREAARALEDGGELAEAHLILGVVDSSRGDFAAAERHYRRALEIDPELALAHAMLGNNSLQAGAVQEGEESLRRALQFQPDLAEAQESLARLYLMRGERERGLVHVEALLEIEPHHAEAHNMRGIVHLETGELAEAEARFRRVLELDPGHSGARGNLGRVFERRGEPRKAVEQYELGLARDPGSVQLAQAAAWLLATSSDADARDGAEALRWARLAAEATGHAHPAILDVLAAAQAESGDFDGAVRTLRGALERVGNPARRAEMEARLSLYRSGRPYRQP